MHYLFAAVYALLAWWFFTAIILVLDGFPRRTFRWSLLGWTVLTAVALWQLYLGRNDTSSVGRYAAFTWGTIAWGWQELSFYTGLITGPRKTACPPDCKGLRHFLHAVSVSLYHELAVIGGCALVFGLLHGAANTTGLWTYLIMWWMHQSAKLNVFFGVRNLNEEYLPEHLRYLAAFFTKKN
ncbi:MAG: DUF3623 domain-containing protein, partial [Herpetosiphonaceae bacterium]|nr:DUF3623 domain-containing protein [Herpetosiphonaceae bacterium]